ncbi:MAG TPA: hypothetical protein VGJ82_06515 [Thermoanaerobaculia bacterium]|jgi:hypothetical protein
MPKGSSKTRKRNREDDAQSAVRVMETIAAKHEEPEESLVEITDEMRAAAAAFGRIGGKIGGPARAAALSKKRRSEIAKKAAAARWKKSP